MQCNYSYSAFARHTIQPQQRIAAEAWKESGKDKSSSMFTFVLSHNNIVIKQYLHTLKKS